MKGLQIKVWTSDDDDQEVHIFCYSSGAEEWFCGFNPRYVDYDLVCDTLRDSGALFPAEALQLKVRIGSLFLERGIGGRHENCTDSE